MEKLVSLFDGIIVGILILILFIWPASALASGPKYDGVKDVRALSGASTSAVFLNWSARAKIINDIPGIRSSCIAGAIVPNLDALERGEADLCHGSSEVQVDLLNGVGRFKGKEYKNIAFLSHGDGFRCAICVVRSDSDIHTVEDLKSKHIATYPKTSGTARMWTKMMAAHGITPENISQWRGRFSNLSAGDIVAGLRDRTIDAFMTSSGFYQPRSDLIELVNTVGVRLIPMDPKAIDKFLKTNATALKTHLPVGLYGNKVEYPTFANGISTNLVRLDLPDDLVYDILKAWFSKEGRKSLYEAFPSAACFILENALQGSIEGIPVHPGAAKFYEEHGITVGKPFKWPKSIDDAINNYGGQWEWPWK